MEHFFRRWQGLLNPALLTAALVVVLPASTLAHDPGLSSLEVRVGRSHLAADLFLSAVDADAARRLDRVPDGDLGAFALQAVEFLIDGRQLRGAVEAIAIDGGQDFRVRLKYGRASGTQLTVRSAVPRQLASGHRELLSIRAEDGSLLAERMLDAHANEGAADLKVAASGAGLLASLVLILGGYWLLESFVLTRRRH